ncbi:MAG: hypothetical protein JWN44_4664 [Myxococcales bacterium]|nr:hypothetical protein [Myxococcales bacterium]
MARRKTGPMTRLRTVVVYQDGKVGYYSRDRIEGGISPVYSSDANLVAARIVRAGTDGSKGHWPAAY